MNKRTLFLLTAGAFALLNSACGDTVIDAESSPPINPTAKINVLVRNASTGNPVDGVIVKLLSTGAIGVTDASNGAVSFPAYVGEHNLLLSKDGYASCVKEATITGEKDVNVYIANEATVSATFYPTTSSLDGYLYYNTKDDNQTSAYAVGAKVKLEITGAFASELLDKVYFADVEANGMFSFPKLPAVGTSYSLSIMPWTNTVDGRTLTASSFPGIPATPLTDGVSAHMTTKNTLTSGDISTFVLESYNSIIKPADPVVFTYSDKINMEKVNKADAYITGKAANVVWGEKTITFNPVGEWTVGPFTINIPALESVKGKTLLAITPSITVKNDKAVDLSDLSVTGIIFDPTAKELKWNTLNGATGYEVYYKGALDDSYLLYPSPISNPLPFATSGSYHFIIRAKNSISITAFSAPVAVTNNP
jgi:hypothetical protein